MSIARNTIYYSSALVYQKVLGFFYFVLIGRFLGVADTGQYVLAVSFIGLFTVLADIGLIKVMTKEIAQKPNTANQLYNQLITLKLVLSFITACLIVLVAHLLSYQTLTRHLIYIAGLGMILDSFAYFNWSVFRGLHNLRYESLSILGFQTLIVGIGSTMLFLGLGVLPVMAATLLGSIFNLFFSYLLLYKKQHFKIKLSFNQTSMIRLAKYALPFALAGVFANLDTMVDTVMLYKLGCSGIIENCEQQLGWYGVAAKIIIAFQFIPMALSTSLFPAFSRQSQNQDKKTTPTYIAALRYLGFIVFPVSTGIIILAPDLIALIWGVDFLPAALPLQILMIALIFIFLDFPYGALLNANSYQTTNTIYMGYAVLVNVLLNFILIAKYSMIGAAITSIVSALVLLILRAYKSRQIINYDLKNIVLLFLKIIISSSGMALGIIYLKPFMSLWLLIVVAVIIYLVLAKIVRLIHPSDILLIKNLMSRT